MAASLAALPPPVPLAGASAHPAFAAAVSVPMTSGGSSGSASSSGETVAAKGSETEGDDLAKTPSDQRRDRERLDSLGKLEGRARTPAKVAAPQEVAQSPPPPKPMKLPRSTDHLRDLATRNRLRSESPKSALGHSGRSSRASVATFDSMLTTGESVYEDAREENTEEDWDDDDEPAELPSLPSITKSPILPDTPPTEEELAEASDPRKTPKASAPRTPPQSSYPDFPLPEGLSPASAFEEQAILLQRRATLQAEASRRIAIRHSVSSTPTDSSARHFRRLSATPQRSAHPSDPHRASVSGTSSLSTSPVRQWHPKPLVLTPARTIQAPLTASPAVNPRRQSVDPRILGHGRTHSNVSAMSTWSSGSRPLSPPNVRAVSPLTLGSLSGPSRRRSMGYVESAGDLALPGLGLGAGVGLGVRHRKSLSGARASWMSSGGAVAPRRGRSASEDTGNSQLTGESSGTRYASDSARGEGESPDSSVWSEEHGKETLGEAERDKKAAHEGGKQNGSPLLDEEEWEMEYYRQTGSSRPALEAVPDEEAEAEASTGGETGGETPSLPPKPSFLAQDETKSEASPRTADEAAHIGLIPTSKAPVIALSHATPSSTRSKFPSPRLSSATTSDRLSYYQQNTSAPNSPPSLAPAAHINSPPRSTAPASPQQPRSPKTPPSSNRRPSAKYDELWNGEPSFESDRSIDTVAEDSDGSLPTTPQRSGSRVPSNLNPARLGSPSGNSSDAAGASPAKKGKPIVIKSVTARSSAANARRSQRLSQIDPPLLGDTHRLSTRMSKRFSGVPEAPEERRAPSRPVSQAVSPPPPPAALAVPREPAANRNSVARASGLAIWPPPPETKTVTLAPPLAYNTDSEMSSSGLESPTDDEGRFVRDQERERARVGYPSSPPRPSGYSYPNRPGRRPQFEPRDPRARHDDADNGSESFLEVLLATEPHAPASKSRAFGSLGAPEEDRRWSNYSSGTMDTFKRGSAASFGSAQTGSTISPSKPGGFTKKLFGGLRAKSPTFDNGGERKKPISIAPAGSSSSSRRGSTKPRPVVSAPLELQAASHAMGQQRSLSSMSSSSQGSQAGGWSSVHSSPGGGLAPPIFGGQRYVAAGPGAKLPPPLSVSGAEDTAEELISLYGGNEEGSRRTSLDSVFRPPPKAYALPPGLLSAGDQPPPPPPHHYRSNGALRPSASPASPTSAMSASPALSFQSILSSPHQQRSRQGSKDSSAGGSFVSASGNGASGYAAASQMFRQGSASSAERSMGMREVLRGQFLER